MNNHNFIGRKEENVQSDISQEDDRFEEFDVEKAMEAREQAEKDKKARDAAESLTHKMASKLEFHGGRIESDSVQLYYDLRKNGFISDEETDNYVLEKKTPAIAIRDAYPAAISEDERWVMACNAQYNNQFSELKGGSLLHACRILEYFSGGNFNDPEKASGDSFRRFMEKYPSALDFDEDASALINSISVGGDMGSDASKRKRAEYAADMARFKKIAYGEQQDRLDVVTSLDKNSLIYGQLTQDVDLARRIMAGDVINTDIEQSNKDDEFYGVADDIINHNLEKNADVKEPMIGDDLGNGYRCASVGGFEDKSDAYASKMDNEDVVFYNGKWYLGVR